MRFIRIFLKLGTQFVMYYKLRCNSTQFVIYYKLRNYYKLQRNSAPLIADLFLFCYERDFMSNLH